MTVLLANAPTRVPDGDDQELFFVKAGSRWPFSIRKRRSEPCRYVPFPFSLAYLGALLEQDGIDVEAFDGVALNAPEETFLARCASYRPQLVLMETTTPTVESDLRLCAELKARTGATIALAGAHATVFARQILQQADSVDWVLCGEYELSALQAIRALLQSGHDRARALAQVPGLVCRSSAANAAGPATVEGPAAVPIEPLDQLPPPARHLFPTRQAPTMWPYWDGFCQHRPAVQLQSSRGCPFRCTFCLWVSVMYQHGPYRTFSAERIVDEMQQVIEQHGAREIYFDDDIFTAKERHVLGICHEIRRRDLHTRWSVMGDAIAVTERGIRAMADAGCVGMKLGIESASAEILANVRKPVRLEKVRAVVALCNSLGIKTHGTITFGLEGETHDTMDRTLAFCCELPVDSIQFSVATPFPGTPWHQSLAEAGRLRGGCLSDYDGARSSVVELAGLGADEVARFAAQAPSRWLRARLRDPRWVARQARYFAQIAVDQGLAGLWRRAGRASDLLFNRPR